MRKPGSREEVTSSQSACSKWPRWIRNWPVWPWSLDSWPILGNDCSVPSRYSRCRVVKTQLLLMTSHTGLAVFVISPGYSHLRVLAPALFFSLGHLPPTTPGSCSPFPCQLGYQRGRPQHSPGVCPCTPIWEHLPYGFICCFSSPNFRCLSYSLLCSQDLVSWWALNICGMNESMISRRYRISGHWWDSAGLWRC